MPQEMNVLCCYSCKMYQVHIVKKARKWQCKLCNEKQSIQQIYFEGSGKDCRLHVQQLNSLKTYVPPFLAISEQDNSNTNYDISANISQNSSSINDKIIESKWVKYIGSPKKESQFDKEDMISENVHKAGNMLPSGKSSYNDINDDSCNFENILNNFDTEYVIDNHETKELHCTSSNIDDRCNLQDNKSKSDRNDVNNIFETYEELDDPLDF